MKKIILFITIVFSISYKAQNTIKPIYETYESNSLTGDYLKDIENFHSQFVGTWIHNDGINYIKITFAKKDMFPETTFNGKSIFLDYLIGEYEYKKNNVTIVNTLNNLNTIHTSIFDYNLRSMIKISRKGDPFCMECGVNEYRLVMYFQELPTRDPEWASHAEFVMRRVIDNGVEKLKVFFDIPPGEMTKAPSAELARFSIPFGNYTFIKQ